MKNTLKFLYFFFLVGTLIDIVATFLIQKFLVFESNPLYFLNSGVILLFLVKLIVVGVISLAVFKQERFNNTDFTRFFYTFMMLSMGMIQLFAGISNIHVMDSSTQVINERYGTEYTIFDVPEDKLEQLVPEPSDAIRAYITLILGVMVYPMFLALFSFFLWQRAW